MVGIQPRIIGLIRFARHYGRRGSAVITPPYRLLVYGRASLKSVREREQVSLSSIPSSRGWFTKASLQNTVDRSEADPSSWRRILLRSSMDFVPVETLFNFQGAVMSVSLIVRIIVSPPLWESHDCGSLPFLKPCMVIHSFLEVLSVLSNLFVQDQSPAHANLVISECY